MGTGPARTAGAVRCQPAHRRRGIPRSPGPPPVGTVRRPRTRRPRPTDPRARRLPTSTVGPAVARVEGPGQVGHYAPPDAVIGSVDDPSLHLPGHARRTGHFAPGSRSRLRSPRTRTLAPRVCYRGHRPPVRDRATRSGTPPRRPMPASPPAPVDVLVVGEERAGEQSHPVETSARTTMAVPLDRRFHEPGPTGRRRETRGRGRPDSRRPEEQAGVVTSDTARHRHLLVAVDQNDGARVSAGEGARKYGLPGRVHRHRCSAPRPRPTPAGGCPARPAGRAPLPGVATEVSRRPSAGVPRACQASSVGTTWPYHPSSRTLGVTAPPRIGRASSETAEPGPGPARASSLSRATTSPGLPDTPIGPAGESRSRRSAPRWPRTAGPTTETFGSPLSRCPPRPLVGLVPTEARQARASRQPHRDHDDRPAHGSAGLATRTGPDPRCPEVCELPGRSPCPPRTPCLRPPDAHAVQIIEEGPTMSARASDADIDWNLGHGGGQLRAGPVSVTTVATPWDRLSATAPRSPVGGCPQLHGHRCSGPAMPRTPRHRSR